jgi:hypothetical protein
MILLVVDHIIFAFETFEEIIVLYSWRNVGVNYVTSSAASTNYVLTRRTGFKRVDIHTHEETFNY